MGWYPKNPNLTQNLQSDSGVNLTRGFLALYSVTPAAAGSNNVVAAKAITGTAATVVSGTLITQPDVPRTVEVKGSNDSDQGTDFPVVVVGADIGGSALTETINMDGTDASKGSLAFGSITSVTLPAGGSGSAMVGLGSLFGLPNKMGYNQVIDVVWDGTKNGTPTIAASSATLAANTIVQASPDGTKVLNVHLIDWALGSY